MQLLTSASPMLRRPPEMEMASHSSILAQDPKDRGAWQATVHGVSKSWAQLSD